MSAQTGGPSIVARDLVRGYGSGVAATPVLRGLSISLWPGQLTLMMGASGSGKSTLLAVLSGLLRPESGSVTALGTSLWPLKPRALEQYRFDHCGYIFQGFNLFPALTAIEQVALPLTFGGERESVALQRARDSLAEVGLAARMELRPSQLSGGEKQRVAIARALVGNPQMLFADEPTSALDSVNSERVIDLLQKIARSHGATVVVVTHDPQLTEHADRVIEMRDGELIADSRDATAAFDNPTTVCPYRNAAVKHRLRLVLLAAAILLALFVTLLLQPQTAVAQPSAAPAGATIVTASGWVDASGGVLKLGARADGVLLAVPVKEGDTVEAGAVLAKLDGRQLDLDARSAALDAERRRLESVALQNRLKLARAELVRLKPLVDAQAETVDTLRATQAQVTELESTAQLAHVENQAAHLKLEQLEATQGRQVVRAPARGQLLRVFAHTGETITAGAPVVSFVADGPLWVRAELDERLFGRVQPGMSAQISPEYDDSKHYPAKVLRVARSVGPVQSLPDVRPASKDDRVVEVVLELDGKDLLIGQRVLVRIGSAQ